MKRYIAVIEIEDGEEIINANVSYVYRSNGMNYKATERMELKEESEEVKNKAYGDGLNDAWAAARKIACTDGYKWRELEEIFGSHLTSSILNSYTASEAIDKMKNYDAGDKIVHVGDEIYSKVTNSKAVVQRIDAWNRYECFTDNGAQFIIDKHTFNDYWVKTGKNYPQIAEVLEQMKEDNE